MKMTQFANFANKATEQILGDVGLERENLTHMFDYSNSFYPFPSIVPNVAGVKFIDYDGTVIYFIPRNEILSMYELPPTVNHKALIAQGWNWSLEDIKTYMIKYSDARMTVGQMMLPADGKTHMILNVGPRLTIPLMIQQTVSEGITINWGDGSEEETIEGTGTVTTNHTYESEGEYEITLEVADGCTLGFGGTVNETACNVFGESATRVYISSLKKLFVGNRVTEIGGQAFIACYNLNTLILSDSVISIGQQAFCFCYALNNFIIPNSITTIGNNGFNGCLSLKNLALSNNVTSIGAGSFNGCYTLKNLAIPNSLSVFSQGVFSNCYALKTLSIPESISSIGSQAFSVCYNLKNLIIPKTITKIEQQAFQNCRTLFTLTILAETPPTLPNANAFSNIPTDCTIYVPHGKGDTYKEASGWSTWVSQIQELPE